MTSAEFKTIRQKVGFSSQDFADYCGVALRTIQIIESGVTKPYGEPLAYLNKVYGTFKNIVLNQRRVLDEQLKNLGCLPDVALVRYKKDSFHEYNKDFIGLPESFHAALLGDFKVYAEICGCVVKIVYFDPEAYFSFLGASIDSRENRAAWASLEIENIENFKKSDFSDGCNK